MSEASSEEWEPGAAGRGNISLPERVRSPWWALSRRLLAALAILVGTVCLVYFDRDAYRDNNDPTGQVSLIDSIYYTTVTLSTTGYGDIAPFKDGARLINAFVITPARIAFLVLLIGTTLEVLASQGREMFRISRWRKRMGHHVVVVGYGTKGRSAVETLVSNGQDRESVVIVDPGQAALADAHADGLAVVTGDATRREVLRRAGVAEADQVIITTNRDDSNVLAILTVRQLNPDVYIVSSAREHENAPLMKQSGANSVITSSDAVGRLLGVSSLSPTLGSVMEDLLTYGEGLEVAERDLLVTEVGKQPQSLPDQVIAVVRDEKVYRYFDPVVTQLARGDRLVVVRPAKELPWAPRPAPTTRSSPPTRSSSTGRVDSSPQLRSQASRRLDATRGIEHLFESVSPFRMAGGMGGGWGKRGSGVPLAQRVRGDQPAGPASRRPATARPGTAGWPGPSTPRA